MRTYVLTAYDEKGKKLLDESFEAETDEEAKAIGQRRLKKKDTINIPTAAFLPKRNSCYFIDDGSWNDPKSHAGNILLKLYPKEQLYFLKYVSKTFLAE